jgi:hypothetical protein
MGRVLESMYDSVMRMTLRKAVQEVINSLSTGLSRYVTPLSQPWTHEIPKTPVAYIWLN